MCVKGFNIDSETVDSLEHLDHLQQPLIQVTHAFKIQIFKLCKEQLKCVLVLCVKVSRDTKCCQSIKTISLSIFRS